MEKKLQKEKASGQILFHKKIKKIKKEKNQKKDVSKKDVKVLVNLTKCSQNWKNIIPQIPKAVPFKRQNANRQNTVKSKEKIKPKAIEAEKNDAPKKDENKIWFDIDKALLPEEDQNLTHISSLNVNIDKESAARSYNLTKAVAVDCEMVGVGENGQDSILARISIVNQLGECLYDKYVIPTEKVTDYRTSVSGIRPDDLKKQNNAVPFSKVQKDVADILKDRILVGHAVHNDLKVLFLSHPKKKIRDTQKCKIFRQMHKLGGLASLKNLAKTILGITIQEGEHNSVVDAQVTMKLYTTYRKQWEADLKDRRTNKRTEDKKLNKEQTLLIKDGKLLENDSDIKISTGNETHKRYLINKLKKRQRFQKKMFK